MPRKRIPTDAMLAARTAAEATRLARIAAAKEARENSEPAKRRGMARQIVQALYNLATLPPEDNPEVLSIARSTGRYPTGELYAWRDRARNARAIANRKHPEFPPRDLPEFAASPTAAKAVPRFFKGRDISSMRKPVDFMRLLRDIGPIPCNPIDDTLLSTLMQRGWVIIEPTPDARSNVAIMDPAFEREWDPAKFRNKTPGSAEWP